MENIRNKFIKDVILIIIVAIIAYIAAQILVQNIINKSFNRTTINLFVLAIVLSSFSIVLLIVYRTKNIQISLYKTKNQADFQSAELLKINEDLQNLSKVLASIDQAVMIVNSNDHITWVNDSFQKLFGFTPLEALGNKVSSLVAGPLTDRSQIEKIDEAIFIKKEPCVVKILHYRKDRSAFWARVSITPLLDEKGELEKYITVSSDISLEYQAELNLVKSEANFKNISHTVDDVLYLYNIKEKKYDFISENCEKILGAPADFFYSGNSYTKKFAHKDDIELLYKANEQIDNGIQYAIEYRIIIGNSIKWIREKSFPVLNNKGELIGNSGVCSDITLEKELNEKLKISKANFKQITETVEDTLYLYNIEDKKYEFISKNCLQIFGIPDQVFYSGKSWSHLKWHPDDINIVNNSFELASNGENFDIEYRIIFNDSIKWIRERSFSSRNENGIVVKSSGVCTDITLEKTKDLELERAYSEAKIVTKIGELINEQFGLINVINAVNTSVKTLTNSDGFGIGIINNDQNTINFPLYIEGEFSYKNISYSLEDNLLCNICSKQDTDIIILDLEKDIFKYTKQPLDYTQGKSSESVIYLPLRIESVVIGVFTVQSFTKQAFTDNQIQQLKSISIFVANAIDKAEKHDQLEEKIKKRTYDLALKNSELIERNYEIELTSQIGIKITQSLRLDELFNNLYTDVSKLFKSEMFGIRLYKEERNEVEYTFGIENNVRDKVYSIPMTDENNYTVWCIKNRTDILINDNEIEFIKYVKECKATTSKIPNSIIMSPIIIEDKVIGVITVQSYNKNVFADHHLHLLRALSAYVSASISNISIYESLEHKIEERTVELKEITNDLIESINYAQRIQFSTLTSEENMFNLFPKSFVFYKPKDIISGDFYRMDVIRTNDKSEFMGFLIGDCTGHGVPGATLAILCSSLLKQSLSEQNVNTVGQSLDFVSRSLSNLFLNSPDKNAINDGMDAGFGVIDRTTNKLYYAGAYRDCHIVRSGVLHNILGDRQHVGFSENPSPFQTTEFQLQVGDCIYLTTDGYVDQFSEATNRKFSIKRFKEIIIEASSLPFTERKNHISTILNSWQGNQDQIDDICVMGIELD